MKKPLIYQFLYAIAAIFPLIILYEIFVYGNKIPMNDYWEIMSLLLSDNNEPTVKGLFTPANEHLVVLPKLIYLFNVIALDGNAMTLKVLTFIFASLQAFVLCKMASKTLECSFKRTLSHMVIIAYSFTPLAIHNFMMGMSGTAWVLANLLTVLAFYCFFLRNEKPYFYKITMIVCGIGAALAYSTGLFTFPAIATAYFLAHRPPLKWLLLLFTAAFSVIAVYLLFFYQLPEHHQQLYFTNIPFILFSVLFMSGMVVGSVVYGSLIGILLLFSVASESLKLKKQEEGSKKNSSIFWLSLAIYSIAFMLACGFARYGTFGINYIGGIQYQTFPALLFIAAFIIWIKSSSLSATGQKILTVAIIGLMCATYYHGMGQVKKYRLGQFLSGLNSYSLLLKKDFLYIIFNIEEIFQDQPEKVETIRKDSILMLEHFKNYPFNGKSLNSCEKAINEGVPTLTVESKNIDATHYSSINDAWDNNFYEIVIEGFDQVGKQEWECLLIVDADNKIIGAANYLANDKNPRESYTGFLPVRQNADYSDVFVVSIDAKGGQQKLYKLDTKPSG